jgi:MFS transporter, SP family, galactose:H+ symporter
MQELNTGPPGGGPRTRTQARTGFVIGVAALAALGGLLFGYDTGVVSGALLFLTPTYHLSTVQQEWVVSALLAGTIVGAALAGPLVDRIGRRPSLVLCGINYLLAAIFLAFAMNYGWLIAGRVWLGLAVGAASMIVPLYLGEMAPPRVRGGVVTLNQLAITVGIFVAYLVDFGFAGVPNGWRWMFGLAAIPGAVLFIGMLVAPETPRWLASRGRREEARRVIERTRPPEEVDGELREIEEAGRQERGWSTLLAPWVRAALIVGVGLGILQQITGINTVIYYAPTTFKAVGLSAAAAIGATAGVGFVNVVTTCAAIVLFDRVGRRPLLLVGIVGMCLSLVVMGLGHVVPGVQPGLTPWVTIGGVLAYVIFFAFSLGPGFWLILAEVFPLSVRGPGMALATLVQWGANLFRRVAVPDHAGVDHAPGWLLAAGRRLPRRTGLLLPVRAGDQAAQPRVHRACPAGVPLPEHAAGPGAAGRRRGAAAAAPAAGPAAGRLRRVT